MVWGKGHAAHIDTAVDHFIAGIDGADFAKKGILEAYRDAILSSVSDAEKAEIEALLEGLSGDDLVTQQRNIFKGVAEALKEEAKIQSEKFCQHEFVEEADEKKEKAECWNLLNFGNASQKSNFICATIYEVCGRDISGDIDVSDVGDKKIDKAAGFENVDEKWKDHLIKKIMENKAATKIQSLFRGHKVRKDSKDKKEEDEKAAEDIKAAKAATSAAILYPLTNELTLAEVKALKGHVPMVPGIVSADGKFSMLFGIPVATVSSQAELGQMIGRLNSPSWTEKGGRFESESLGGAKHSTLVSIVKIKEPGQAERYAKVISTKRGFTTSFSDDFAEQLSSEFEREYKFALLTDDKTRGDKIISRAYAAANAEVNAKIAKMKSIFAADTEGLKLLVTFEEEFTKASITNDKGKEDFFAKMEKENLLSSRFEKIFDDSFYLNKHKIAEEILVKEFGNLDTLRHKFDSANIGKIEEKAREASFKKLQSGIEKSISLGVVTDFTEEERKSAAVEIIKALNLSKALTPGLLEECLSINLPISSSSSETSIFLPSGKSGYQASVLFNGSVPNSDIAYIPIPHTNFCVRVRNCLEDGNVKVYRDGIAQLEHHKKGDIVFDSNSVFHYKELDKAHSMSSLKSSYKSEANLVESGLAKMQIRARSQGEDHAKEAYSVGGKSCYIPNGTSPADLLTQKDLTIGKKNSFSFEFKIDPKGGILDEQGNLMKDANGNSSTKVAKHFKLGSLPPAKVSSLLGQNIEFFARISIEASDQDCKEFHASKEDQENGKLFFRVPKAFQGAGSAYDYYEINEANLKNQYLDLDDGEAKLIADTAQASMPRIAVIINGKTEIINAPSNSPTPTSAVIVNAVSAPEHAVAR